MSEFSIKLAWVEKNYEMETLVVAQTFVLAIEKFILKA